MELNFTFSAELSEGKHTKIEVCFYLYATNDQYEVKDLEIYNFDTSKKLDLNVLQDDEREFILRQADKLANEHATEAYRQRLDMLSEQAIDWARKEDV